jgi:hypothetical protein
MDDLATIDWNAVYDAYGPAEQAQDRINDLASFPDCCAIRRSRPDMGSSSMRSASPRMAASS